MVVEYEWGLLRFFIRLGQLVFLFGSVGFLVFRGSGSCRFVGELVFFGRVFFIGISFVFFEFGFRYMIRGQGFGRLEDFQISGFFEEKGVFLYSCFLRRVSYLFELFMEQLIVLYLYFGEVIGLTESWLFFRSLVNCSQADFQVSGESV